MGMLGQEEGRHRTAIDGLPPEAAPLLDNPIWHSLLTEHAGMALGDGCARRYPPHIGPLSGIPAQDEENYAALASLAPDDIVMLLSLEPFRISQRWTELRRMSVVQMVALASRQDCGPVPDGAQIRRLTAEDAPAMVALAKLTEPGPFRLRTLEMGGFYGAFERERLVAMAGQRMHLPGLVEVSGVCTHPEIRGRGYAPLLMTRVMMQIEQEGKTAFLHALAGNPAIRIYERLGFRLRQTFHCGVFRFQPA